MSVSRIWSVCVLILCCLVMPGALVAGEVASFPDGYTYERYQRDRESAEKGDAEAQFLMGYLHHRSLVKFVEPDSGKALGWYQKAALQGHAQSAQVLGLMFQKGDGTEADPRAAKQWFQYAADRGLAQSQYAVGLL